MAWHGPRLVLYLGLLQYHWCGLAWAKTSTLSRTTAVSLAPKSNEYICDFVNSLLDGMAEPYRSSDHAHGHDSSSTYNLAC